MTDRTRYTPEARSDLEHYLATHTIPKGLGDKDSACTLAAINLALTGELTDEIPDCMSVVLGGATIRLQDAMPADMRNSPRYKSLVPHMPGTGRDREDERLVVLLDWMWGTVLPELQDLADAHGFGDEWRTMCRDKTRSAAYHASHVAARAATYATAQAAASADFWLRGDPVGVLERMTFLEDRPND